MIKQALGLLPAIDFWLKLNILRLSLNVLALRIFNSSPAFR